jgi:hypothetical protein
MSGAKPPHHVRIPVMENDIFIFFIAKLLSSIRACDLRSQGAGFETRLKSKYPD